MAKEAWRTLVGDAAATKALSAKWLNHKPTVEEFELDDYNLNVLFKERNRFEDSVSSCLRRRRRRKAGTEC